MEISTIGLDLAKNVLQVYGISATGDVFIRKALRRSQMLPFFEKLPPCLVGAEGCGTSHHWAREPTRLGHEVRLMPAAYVKPYAKRGKNDACRCRSDLRSVHTADDAVVPIKSREQAGGAVAAPRAQPFVQTAHPAGLHDAKRTR